jgi:predicted transcriptional regulator
MARPKSASLTDAETRLMKVLWERRHATVSDVVTALAPVRPVSYSTVQTMLRILEEKGYVAHRKRGRAFVYRPIVEKAQARRRALSHLLSRLFDNSPSLLVLNVLEDERIEPAELARVKKFIEEA